MANTNDEEIIEKRPSHPIATACLVLAAVGLVGAIVFQVLEISEVRSGLLAAVKSKDNPHKIVIDEYTKAFKKAVQDVEAANDHPSIKPTTAGEKGGAAPAADGKAEPAPTEEKAAEEVPAPSEEKAPKGAPAKAAKAAEKAAEEPPADATADEKAAEEPPADAKADEKAAEEPAADAKAEEKAEEPAEKADEKTEEPKKSEETTEAAPEEKSE